MSNTILAIFCKGPQKLGGLETSLVVQWLRFHFHMQRFWVQSLVWELRSHRPHGQKNQNIKQEQYCNKFNKDFKKMIHIKKSEKKPNLES